MRSTSRSTISARGAPEGSRGALRLVFQTQPRSGPSTNLTYNFGIPGFSGLPTVCAIANRERASYNLSAASITQPEL